MSLRYRLDTNDKDWLRKLTAAKVILSDLVTAEPTIRIQELRKRDSDRHAWLLRQVRFCRQRQQTSSQWEWRCLELVKSRLYPLVVVLSAQKADNGSKWEKILGPNPNDATEVEWHKAFVSHFEKPTGFIRAFSYASMKQLLVEWLDIKKIDLDECRRTAPVTSFHHTLSYLVIPLERSTVRNQPLPEWQMFRCGKGCQLTSTTRKKPKKEIKEKPPVRPHHTTSLPTGYTCLFSAVHFGDEKVWTAALADFPNWIIDLANGTLQLNKQELCERIESDPFFDCFPVSLGGWIHSKGVKNLGQTLQRGPRRLTLFDDMGRQWSKRWKCYLRKGYVYSNGYTLPPFYTGRTIADFPGIAELKIHVWKKVWSQLSPISKCIPPNGAQILCYFSAFDSKINFHKDVNARMQSPKNNSQVPGTSVIVVSLFLGQLVQFATNQGKREFIPVAEFYTHHKSVWVLHPHDDLVVYHGTGFHKRNKKEEFEGNKMGWEGVRVAIAFRWLGRKALFFDGLNAFKERRYRMVVERPRSVIDKKYKDKPDVAEEYKAYLP